MIQGQVTIIDHIKTSIGLRFSVIGEGGAEIAHGYLYFMHNDLHTEPFAFLEDVWVKEEWRGQGVGTELIKLMIEKARLDGAYKLIATSRDSRPDVHTMYVGLGFEQYGREFRMNFNPVATNPAGEENVSVPTAIQNTEGNPTSGSAIVGQSTKGWWEVSEEHMGGPSNYGD